MRSPEERQALALSFLAGLSGEEDDPRRILVGPGALIEERLEIDRMFRGWPQDAFNNLAEEMRLTLRWRFRDQDGVGRGLRSAIARHILCHGTALWQRPDGISFWSVPDPDYPMLPIAQVAICDGGGTPVLAGIYHGPSLRVFADFCGRGIGSDLVVEHVLANQGLLNWDLDSCAYSPEGEVAHLAGLRKLRALARVELAGPDLPQI